MKIADIKPGIVYYHSTDDSWLRYFKVTTFRRFAVRFDDTTTRYRLSSGYRSEYHADKAGQYLRGYEVGVDGAGQVTAVGQVCHVLPRYIVGLYTDCARAAAEHAAVMRSVETARQQAARDVSKRAEKLRDRVAALGLSDLFTVEAKDIHHGTPHVVVKLGAGYALDTRERALTEILDRLDQADPRAAYLAGFRAGEAANDAARDKALGYELRPDQEKALKAYDDDAVYADPCPAGESCTGEAFPGHPAHPVD